MESKSQMRTPLNINALLIGEKTVPKGCRVMNINQNGMQLECDADGRLLTFKDGDSVDVHLTIRFEGKQKKLTIPSWVRHVTSNTVAVEFHQPDPALVDLIESYRVSEQHKLEASLGRMERRGGNRKVSALAGGLASTERQATGQAGPVQKQNNRLFYSIILATVFTACVITGGYVYTASIDSRISSLETISERQSTELAEIQNRVFTASLQEGRYTSLNARLTALNDAFVNLENRIAQILPPLASPPGQAAGSPETSSKQPDTAATAAGPARVSVESNAERNIGQSGPEKAASARVADAPDQRAIEPSRMLSAADGSLAAMGGSDEPPSTSNDKKGEAEPPSLQASVSTGQDLANGGPWVINLISSTDRSYVERFSKNSGAAQHNAVLSSAMVNGRQYWRLQITGFRSAAEARKHAADVKQAIGLKDFWIFKQK